MSLSSFSYPHPGCVYAFDCDRKQASEGREDVRSSQLVKPGTINLHEATRLDEEGGTLFFKKKIMRLLHSDPLAARFKEAT